MQTAPSDTTIHMESDLPERFWQQPQQLHSRERSPAKSKPMVVPPYHLNFWHSNTPKPSHETFRAREWLPSSPTMTLKEIGDDVGDMPTIDLAVL
mmetsp:Transcript_54484/g.156653  ORF Transcript_54484/g.156653 Transcript_54484/m.156653 type:complete len:95 (+) Transcript_54484:166-450(+)